MCGRDKTLGGSADVDVGTAMDVPHRAMAPPVGRRLSSFACARASSVLEARGAHTREVRTRGFLSSWRPRGACSWRGTMRPCFHLADHRHLDTAAQNHSYYWFGGVLRVRAAEPDDGARTRWSLLYFALASSSAGAVRKATWNWRWYIRPKVGACTSSLLVHGK